MYIYIYCSIGFSIVKRELIKLKLISNINVFITIKIQPFIVLQKIVIFHFMIFTLLDPLLISLPRIFVATK